MDSVSHSLTHRMEKKTKKWESRKEGKSQVWKLITGWERGRKQSGSVPLQHVQLPPSLPVPSPYPSVPVNPFQSIPLHSSKSFLFFSLSLSSASFMNPLFLHCLLSPINVAYLWLPSLLLPVLFFSRQNP